MKITKAILVAMLVLFGLTKSEAQGVIKKVIIRRTACFGTCPDYLLEVNSSGLVKFTGFRFTTKEGSYEKKISKKKAGEILAQLTNYRVDTLKENYQNNIPDVPGMFYRIVYADKIQTINNAGFGPPFLQNIGQAIDEVGHVDNTWKKVRTYKPKQGDLF